MRQNKREYADNPAFMTQTEALNILEMYYPTLNRYSRLLGIKSVREGRCTFYRRADIEHIKLLKSSLFSRAVGLIERETGKKVKEIVFEY